jgi:Raf kinase inhibitor-like YbhB/YbcL family protein
VSAAGVRSVAVSVERLVIGVVVGIGLAACTAASSQEASTMAGIANMTLTSPAFENGGPIPATYTCDGEDRSPPLRWEGVPDGTQAFALIVTDPDAGGFVHWLLTDIPGDRRELPEGEGDAIGVPGPMSFGRTGWGGPCPPGGEHRYTFTLYALSEALGLGGSADAAAVRSTAEELTLGVGELTGVYAR